MIRDVRKRFWLEVALGGLAGFLAVVTAVWREWIEVVFRIDPDAGSGSLEWLVVAGLLSATVIAGLLARWELVRSPSVVAESN